MIQAFDVPFITVDPALESAVKPTHAFDDPSLDPHVCWVAPFDGFAPAALIITYFGWKPHVIVVVVVEENDVVPVA